MRGFCFSKSFKNRGCGGLERVHAVLANHNINSMWPNGNSVDERLYGVL